MMQGVPFEWMAPARSNVPPPYWITYFGDIYSGTYIDFHQANDRFFILSNNQFHDYQALKTHTLEAYQKIAWEIRDPKIIYKYIPRTEALGNETMPQSYSRDWNKKMKRMFIFGAGASAFCSFNDTQDLINNSVLKPPTGYEIFDGRFDPISLKYAGAIASIPDFEAMERDIEGCLEDDWSFIRNSYSPHITARHLNIQFYLQNLFSQISEEVTQKYFRYNLYARLANKLLNAISGGNEQVSIVSFNYDTILDTFLERAMQVKFSKMSDYIDSKRNNILLLKPHGSSNWGWPFMMERIGNMNGKSLPEFLYEKKYVPSYIYYYLLGDYKKMIWEKSWGYEQDMNPNNMGRFTINKNVIEVIDKLSQKKYLPALQLPYRDKDEFVMPFTHYEALTNAFRETEELFLIGWKGNEDGFNRLMKTHAYGIKKIVIVNPDSATVIKNLSQYINLSGGQNSPTIEIVPGFKEFVIDKLDNYLKN
jgi:hypothetical protein